MKHGIDLYVIRFPKEARAFAPVAIILEDPDLDDTTLAERVLMNPSLGGARWFTDETLAMNAARSLVAQGLRVFMHDPDSDVWRYDGHQVIDYTGLKKGPEVEQQFPRSRSRW